MDANDDELYDESRGPRSRRRTRPLTGIWDDPTWIRVEVDEAFMADEDRKAVRYGWRPTLPASDPLPQRSAKEWISIREAAELTRGSYHNLYRLLMWDQMPFKAVKFGSVWRVRRVEVEAYVSGRRVLADDGDEPLGEGGPGPG